MTVTRVILVTALVLVGCDFGDDGGAVPNMLGPSGAAGTPIGVGGQGGGDLPGTGAGGLGGGGDAGGAGGPVTGAGGTTPAGTGGTPTVPTAAEDEGCPDIFTQDSLRTYEIEIAPEQWAMLEAEFRAGPPLLTMDEEKTYYPLRSLKYGDEVRTDASIRLRGSSSWAFTIMEDPNPKAQFLIAFDKSGTEVPFHGIDRIAFDMPRLDRTLLHERLSYAYIRLAGLPAPCANSAQLIVNGQLYGVYVSKEHYGGKLLKRLFPAASHGALLKSGMFVEENWIAYSPARLMQFWLARDINAMLPIIDLESTLRIWAAEAVLNNADGYWGGDHNFFTYDHPQRGFTWLPDDPDATFEWLGMMQHPVYWWQGRAWVPPVIGQHYLAVVGDETWRQRFVGAIQQNLELWDVPRIQGWIDAWSAQIADAVARDPHLPFMVSDHRTSVSAARNVVLERANYLRSFLTCEQSGGTDSDNDGYPWCRDCDDARPDAHPGATEICGDGIDQDCDSVIDDGC